MSILLADNSATTLPATVARAASVDTPAAVLWIVIGWAVIALIVAAMLGAFRGKSIVGPQRLLPKDTAWDWLIVLCMAYYAGIATFLATAKWIHPSPDWNVPLQAAPASVTFIVGILMLWRLQPGAIKSIGLGLNRIPGGLAGGTATLFVVYPFILLLSVAVEKIYNHFQIRVESHQILQFLSGSNNRVSNIIAIVLATVIAPLNEELVFRGLLQTLLSRFFGWARLNGVRSMMGPQLPVVTLSQTARPGFAPVPPPGARVRWAAVIISSVIFTLNHDPVSWVPIFVLAIGLGYVYERTANLWMTITAHALFNSCQILFFLAAKR